ncbi:MAG: carbohydrate ABC transporter substrate-binding protein [Ruminococcus sp.]|nr:carbohydrate ABC transporter substrate-binding protein [Ruminococcus sp.]
MKKLKLKITAVFLIALTLVFSASCAKSEPKYQSDKILVYCTEGAKSWYKDLFSTYNTYCSANKNLNLSYQVDYVTFENEIELYNKMSTEIMAGGGPDIFLTNQYLPFEKMIEAKLFANVDEIFKENGEKLDTSNLNKNVLDSGIFHGERYIVPLIYSPNIHISSKRVMEKFNMPTEQNSAITYSDKDFFNTLLKYSGEYNLYTQSYDSSLLSEIICDYIDFNKKEIDLDNKEFKDILDIVTKLINANKNIDDASEDSNYKESIFTDELYNFASLQESFMDWEGSYEDIRDIHVFLNKEHQDDTVIYRGPVRNKDDSIGTIEFGIAVNKNSKKKEKVIEFIKYALSDDGQSHLTRRSAVTGFPINYNVLEKRIKNAADIEDSKGRIVGVESEIMKACIDAVKNVKKCELNRSYYKGQIIGGLVWKYADGKLPKNKFIRQLTTATKFYLEE